MTWDAAQQDETVLAAITDEWVGAGEIRNRLPDPAPGFGAGYFDGTSLSWPLRRLVQRGLVEQTAGRHGKESVWLYRRAR